MDESPSWLSSSRSCLDALDTLNVRRSLRIAKGFPRRLATALIPNRAQLPLTFWWQNVRGALEPELLWVLKQKKRSGIAIDVGANQGLYSYALAKIFDRVEAFEPNSSAATQLSRYASGNIAIHDVAISQHKSQTNLYTPVSSDGVEYAGWGSLHREMLPPSDAIRIRTVSTRSLDSYNFDDVSFMKIDVEGHELDVLEGATYMIARYRPLILIEVKPRSRRSVWDFLSTRQYQCFLLENSGLQPLKAVGDFTASVKENFIWMPDQGSTWPNE